jgi:trans-2-enoyl-CoA reductase
MKNAISARLHGFGRADEVLRLEELPVPQPGPGKILVEMLAASINPADLNIIEGKYGELPQLPATIGNEGAGRVAALGPGVTDFAVGDLVLPLTRTNWTSHLVVSADRAVKLPAGLDPFQATMMAVNPPSAWGMLENFETLTTGDWIVQNAANSAVGRCVIQIAKSRGLRTLNVVRREDVIEELTSLGADAVVLESTDLREVAPQVCGGRLPRLALNAVGGASALNLANALADGGTVVTYGAMGRQPLKIPNGLLIFRGLRFEGFWLRKMQQDQALLRRVMTEMADLSLSGRLHLPVHRVFGLSAIHAALEEAGGEKRSGKVLLDLRR